MRIRPIMLIAATAAVIATAGGAATAATSASTATPTPTAHGKPSGAPTATAHGAGSTDAPAASSSSPSVTRAPATPAAFTVTSTKTEPIDAGAVAGILASCLGSDASQYHSVIAVRTPVASGHIDGVVLAVNSAGQYVQCESKGDKGESMAVPPTFINDRLWGADHLIEYFDSVFSPAGAGQVLSLGAGHYASDVAKVAISYGDDPTQYPAVMAGGAFVYTAAISTGSDANARPPFPYIHAYNADGKEIFNQKTQPLTKPAPR